MAITRRAVLAAGAVGLGSGVGVAVAIGEADVSAELSRDERATVAAAAATWFPGEPFPVSGDDQRVVDAIEQIVMEVLAPSQRLAFRAVVRALQLGTLAARGRAFHDLDAEARRDVLQVWADPSVLPRRVALDSLKAVVGMAYFRVPEVLDHVGYRQTCGVSLGQLNSVGRGRA